MCNINGQARWCKVLLKISLQSVSLQVMICSHAPAIHDHGRSHDHGHGHDHDHDHDHDHGHKVSQFIIFIHIGTVRKDKDV